MPAQIEILQQVLTAKVPTHTQKASSDLNCCQQFLTCILKIYTGKESENSQVTANYKM